MFYLPGVYTLTDTKGNQSPEYSKIFGKKTQYLMNTLYIHTKWIRNHTGHLCVFYSNNNMCTAKKFSSFWTFCYSKKKKDTHTLAVNDMLFFSCPHFSYRVFQKNCGFFSVSCLPILDNTRLSEGAWRGGRSRLGEKIIFLEHHCICVFPLVFSLIILHVSIHAIALQRHKQMYVQ